MDEENKPEASTAPDQQGLTPEQRASAIKAASKDQYALIGEFATQFELICFYMRQQILFAISHTIHSQPLVNALTAELTAYPLLQAFRSIMVERLKPTGDSSKIVSAIYKRASDAIEERNTLLHGTSFITWASTTQTDFSTATGFKAKNKKEGLVSVPIEISEAAIRPKIDELIKIQKLVLRLGGCAMLGREVEKNFRWNGKEVDVPLDH